MNIRVEIIKKLQAGHTDADIAIETGVSRARVQQIRADWEPHARVQEVKAERLPVDSYDAYKAGMEAAAKLIDSLCFEAAAAIREEIKKL